MDDKIGLRSAGTRRILEGRRVAVDWEVRQRAGVERVLTRSAGINRETIQVDMSFVDEIPGIEAIRNGHATSRAGNRCPVSNVNSIRNVITAGANIEDTADATLQLRQCRRLVPPPAVAPIPRLGIKRDGIAFLPSHGSS